MDDTALTGTDGANFDTKQLRLLSALLTERTVEAAARKAGVSKSGAYRQLREPAFADELKRREFEVLDGTQRGLLSLSGTALDVYGEVLIDGEVSAATRVRAADSVITHTLKLRELIDLESRIAALEDRLSLSEGRT
jgi:molybdenum-dependent DNA-binding transcriptional regulator ModE